MGTAPPATNVQLLATRMLLGSMPAALASLVSCLPGNCLLETGAAARLSLMQELLRLLNPMSPSPPPPFCSPARRTPVGAHVW